MQRGQTLIELIIAIGLAAILLPALLGGFAIARSGRAQQEQRVAAINLMKEAEEATRVIALNSWDNLVDNTYHATSSGTTWQLVAGPEQINGFTRSINIASVYRDGGGDITIVGGTQDLSTKKITVTVSWLSPIPASVNSIFYLTRHKNLSHLETTVADFTPGASSSGTTSIAITNTSGGEIVLGAGGGGGDWCQPSLTLATEDLPKNGVANAVSAIEGKIFTGTGENASGVSYATVDVTTTHPPDPSLQETFDGYKTNGVFGDENFAYLATDNNFKEIVVINLNEYSDPPTNSKYKEEGYFDAPGNGSGNTINTMGNYGYMTSGNKFYIFDLSSKSGSRSVLNSTGLTLSGAGVKITVVGNYAYVATSNTSSQLQIIDISNPASPTIVGNFTADGLAGKDVYVNTSGTRAYLATEVSSTKNEFFIVNIQNKSVPTQVSGGVYNTSGMNPKGVTVVTGNRAIVVGTGGTNQYQVININNENLPQNCGNLQVPSGINGVSSILQSNGYAYSYIITGDSTAELKIILGGAGAGNNYSPTGVFESATFDAGREVAWNSITANSSVPQNTTLQFKIGIKDGLSGSCLGVSFSNSDFVGPDGNTSSFFPSTGGFIPFNNNGSDYENPGRCMRYRAYLDTTDSTQTPVIYDVSLNYSP